MTMHRADMPEPIGDPDARYRDLRQLLTLSVPDERPDIADLLRELDEAVGARLVAAEDALLADLGFTWDTVPVHVARKRSFVD